MRFCQGIKELWITAFAAYLFFGCVVPFTHTCRDDQEGCGAQTHAHETCPDDGLTVWTEGSAALGKQMPTCLACLLAKTIKATRDAAKESYAARHFDYGPALLKSNLGPADPSVITRLFRGPPARTCGPGVPAPRKRGGSDCIPVFLARG